jgi:hypothetical protein
MNINQKERLLCYAAGILNSKLANPNYQGGVENWLIQRCIRDANRLIDTIMDDEKLLKVLKENVSI